ncbi:MAG: Co2+/Mg2+ efflux protein ApaG [Gammaproteobacteria bacterium]
MENDQENIVNISVETAYLDDQSVPEQDRYVFAYTITIQNAGEQPVKLLRRHWIITDANNKIQEVRGDGVVGVQPHLAPGQSFTYTSGAILETPVGCMQGSYQMITDDGDSFDAPIDVFRLSIPITLH